jgi:lipopolysaccharide export system permease protein
MFTALLMAGTFLGRLTGWLVDGVPLAVVAEGFGLLLPGLMVKTFPMAVLLAALLAFGRLSSDSEIVALRAGGAGIGRIVWPVAAFSFGIAALAWVFNEAVVPQATRRSLELANQVATMTNPSRTLPMARNEVRNGKLRLTIAARRVNALDRTLQGATLIAYDAAEEPTYVLHADQLRFTDENDWAILGAATLLAADGSTRVNIQDGAWPEGLEPPQQDFTALIKPRDDDFDARSMAELRADIARFRAEGSRTPAQIANYEFGYWNKLSVPLSAVVFGALGAVLGIRNHRTGTATGFALAVAIIFGYVTLTNFMSIWSQGGLLPSWAASFAPLGIGLVAAGVIMWRRNL